MFLGVIYLCWGCCVTQMSEDVNADGGPVEHMSHEPLGYVSGVFKNSQFNWPTVDKEGYAMVATFQRLEYLLWRGVSLFCDYCNLAYIFNLEEFKGMVVSKTTSQRLEHWRTYLGQYRLTIVHIPFADNNWGGLLSRLRPKQGVTTPVRATAVFVNRSFYTLPTKQSIWETQALLLE